MIHSAKEAINFFYLCLFAISVLFLSTFAFKLHQINSNVLGIRTESITDEIGVSKQVNFWKDFTFQHPEYYEGWMELYGLTGEDTYLNKARVIDPNR